MGERLSPGDTAPDFSLPDDRATVSSATCAAEGDRLLLPGRDDPGVHDAGLRLQRLAGELKADGYTVVGISPDSPAKLAKFRDKEGLTVTLLSDADRAVMNAWGAFGEKKLYGKTVEGVIRSTIVLDEDGTVSNAWYNVKATGHVAKVRRDLGLE